MKQTKHKIKSAAKKTACSRSRKSAKPRKRTKNVANGEPSRQAMYDAILRNNKLLDKLVGLVNAIAPAVGRIADAVAKNGNAYKGPKTPYMAEQLKGLAEFTKENPIIDGDSSRNAYCVTKRYWGKHQGEFDHAAKLKGNARGYSSPKVLADAHKNMMKKTSFAP